MSLEALDQRFTAQAIQAAFARKHYAFFTQGMYNLNIFGVRSSDKTPNVFNDRLFCVYKEPTSGEQFVVRSWMNTTDPGNYWIEHPMNPEGCAVLIPGQYPHVWSLGKHKDYEALVQTGVFRVWREKSVNSVGPGSPVFLDATGINCHRAVINAETKVVEMFSAGCMVFARSWDFDEFMTIVNRCAAMYGPTFTYTLFDEADFNA